MYNILFSYARETRLEIINFFVVKFLLPQKEGNVFIIRSRTRIYCRFQAVVFWVKRTLEYQLGHVNQLFGREESGFSLKLIGHLALESILRVKYARISFQKR